MNYLAHVFLARDTQESRLGNLLGDFAKGLDLATLPPAIQQGVHQHRDVDRFVDRHPVFLRSRSRLPARFTRYAGILIDVYSDHFLARHWERFSARPMDEVTGSLYDAIDRYFDLLPPRLQEVSDSMRRHDWLGSYRDLDNIDRALRGIARRARRDNPIGEGGAALRDLYPELESDFLALFPDLVDFAQGWNDVESTE